jgi:hypothetical protein
MNWFDIGIPSLVVLISGGLFYWHHKIMQSTIQNLKTENDTLNSRIQRDEKETIAKMNQENPEIPSSSLIANSKPDVTLCDIGNSHPAFSDFEGTYYSWNPSWQTELSTNPDEWMEMHRQRYRNTRIKRIIYIIGSEGIVKDPYSKLYYLTGFKAFVKEFTRRFPSDANKMEDKLEVYLMKQLSSELTLFAGKKDGHHQSIILFNEPPLMVGGTPLYSLEINSSEMYEKIRNMCLEGMQVGERIDVAALLKNRV